MATNPYFRHLGHYTEQELLDDLVVESIQQYGLDCVYLPRSFQKEDLILGEDTLSKFTSFYEMEMYIAVFDRFGGQGDFIQKFGIQVEDTATIIVSVSTFHSAVGGQLSRPREGDLLYFPLKDTLFEITFLEHEPSFYQLGKQYMYELKARMFNYTNQEVNVGIPEIDNFVDDMVYSVNVVLGAGSGNYLPDEIIYQGANLNNASASATVISYDTNTQTAKVKFPVGEFNLGAGVVKGNTSLASRALTSVNYQDNVNLLQDNNKALEDQASTLIVDNDSVFGKF